MFNVKKILSFFMVLMMLFTSFSILGTDNSYAAAKKTAKKVTVSIVSTSQTSVTIKWNKIKKPDKGYAVFRDGVAVAHLGKKATTYTDKGLKAGTNHKYQIKTYKTKKVKKNKKKVIKYKYKKKSNVVTAKTKASPPTPAPTPAVDPDSLDPYINLEKDSYDMLVGETIVVRATSNHGGYTGYTIHNSSCIDIISRDTSLNEKGEHVENVTIKGLKAGTTIIEFTNSYAGLVSKPVTINISNNSTPGTTFSIQLPELPKTYHCYWSNANTNYAACRVDKIVVDKNVTSSSVYGTIYITATKTEDGNYMNPVTKCGIKYSITDPSGAYEYSSGIVFSQAVNTNNSFTMSFSFSCPVLPVRLNLSDVFPSDF